MQSATTGNQRPAAPPPPRPASPAVPAQPVSASPATTPPVTALGRAAIAPSLAAAGSANTVNWERLLPAILSLAQALAAQGLSAQALKVSEQTEAAAAPLESGNGEVPGAGPSRVESSPPQGTRYAEAFENLGPFELATPTGRSPVEATGENIWASNSFESAWIAEDEETEAASSEWID